MENPYLNKMFLSYQIRNLMQNEFNKCFIRLTNFPKSDLI